MHYWGDDWPYWDDLYKAQHLIYKVFDKHSCGCLLSMKEKYGTIRYEWIFAPMWLTNQYRWIHKLLRYIPFMVKNKDYIPLLRVTMYGNPLEKWFLKRGSRALKIAVNEAIKQYPHIEKELTCDLDWRNYE